MCKSFNIQRTYSWNKDMSVLLKGQITKKCRKRYICEKCNDSFEKEEKYKDHVYVYMVYVYMKNKK